MCGGARSDLLPHHDIPHDEAFRRCRSDENNFDHWIPQDVADQDTDLIYLRGYNYGRLKSGEIEVSALPTYFDRWSKMHKNDPIFQMGYEDGLNG